MAPQYMVTYTIKEIHSKKGKAFSMSQLDKIKKNCNFGLYLEKNISLNYS